MTLSGEERDELRATVRSLLGNTNARPWDQMVELGLTTMHVPERYGGAGAGYAGVAVVLHELGRAVTATPFLGTTLGRGALALADNEDIATLAGASVATVAFASTSGSYDLSRLTTTWRSAGSSVRLTGAAGFVLDADAADTLVVAARNHDGTVSAVAVDASAPGIYLGHAPTVDQTRRLFTVSFDDVEVADDRMLCAPGPSAEELLGNVLAVGVVAAACDAVGVAERAMEVAAEYAKDRIQFGKPIGSFQAVKHHCANMAIAVEASRAATRAAAAALDGDPAAWPKTAAITSSYVGPACSHACALALLVHGGIGFTWEHDSHLFLKRAKLDEVLFGTPSWHRRRLADAVFPPLAS